jgi:5-methyltetrahydropteroyltriglutamate--homocysteine methyltransferase
MTDPDAPIRTTHVGSLVRPAELVAYLRKIDAGDDYDKQAYRECLARSVRDVVQAQRDAGIDIVSDGEFGKSAWNYYVYERLGGISCARARRATRTSPASTTRPPTGRGSPSSTPTTSRTSRNTRARAGTGPASRP